MNNFTSPAAPKARNTFAAKGGPQAIPVSQFTGQPLLAHQGRVVFERIQLADKVNSLEKFVLSEAYGKVSRKEQDLLAVQLEHMAIYLRVLDIRVAKFMDVKLYTCHKQVLARPMNRRPTTASEAGTCRPAKSVPTRATWSSTWMAAIRTTPTSPASSAGARRACSNVAIR